MTKLHDILREFLEDVQTYLMVTLNAEALSENAKSRKDSLLMKIQYIRHEIPLLIKLDEMGAPIPPPRPPPKPSNGMSKDGPPSSPTTPYLDMQGSFNIPPVFQPSPVSEHRIVDEKIVEEENYEEYVCESEASLECSFKTDSVSVSNSEENVLDENSAKSGEYPDIPASDLMKTSDKSGFLDKKGKERLGGLYKPFQRRWCAIKDGLLIYYMDKSDKKQRGIISLLGYEGRPAPSACKDQNKKSNCFEIVSPGKRTYSFIAYSVKDMKQWISAIERNSARSFANNNNNSDLSQTVIPNPALSSSKLLPPINTNIDSVRPKAKPPLPEPETPEDLIYEAVGDAFDDLLYGEGSSMLVNGDQEEIYIDADGEAPKHFPENQLDFKREDWYVGLWDCKPEDDSELEFMHGDLIRIVSKEYDKHDWWTGELNGKTGFVPKSYLQEAYAKSSD